VFSPLKWRATVSTTIGKVVLYGSEYGLSQRFCRLDFNGRDVQALQNANGWGKSGKLQITNNVSGMPRHYSPRGSELPALWKAAAHRMNYGQALPFSFFTHCAGSPCA
jgi:hypothetical protein